MIFEWGNVCEEERGMDGKKRKEEEKERRGNCNEEINYHHYSYLILIRK